MAPGDPRRASRRPGATRSLRGCSARQRWCPRATPSCRPARDAEPLGRARGRGAPWAQLLRRVFATDVLLCPCGGRRSVVPVVVDSAMARAVLAPLGLPCTPGTFAPARDPPQAEFWSTTLRSPHDRRLARQRRRLRRRRPNVRPLTQPTSGGAQWIAGSTLGPHRAILGERPNPICLSYPLGPPPQFQQGSGLRPA